MPYSDESRNHSAALLKARGMRLAVQAIGKAARQAASSNNVDKRILGR